MTSLKVTDLYQTADITEIDCMKNIECMARIVMPAVKYIANIDAYKADKVAVLTQ